MPTKVLPSCRAAGGRRRRRQNGSQQGCSQLDSRSCQTRRPRLSGQSFSNNYDQNPSRLNEIQEALSYSERSASRDRDFSSQESGELINLGSIGPRNPRSPIGKDNASNVSSGSEDFFQEQYRSLLSGRTGKLPSNSLLLQNKQSKPAQPQQRGSMKGRFMQLCSPHMRQLMSKDPCERSGGKQQSSKVAYQVALSPLTASDNSSVEMSDDQTNFDPKYYAKKFARIARQNKNTSNRKQHRQLQRLQKEPKCNADYNLPVQSEMSPRTSMPLSPSLHYLPQSQQQQRQSQSRRSNRDERRNDFTNWDYEQNLSNQNEIYVDDRRKPVNTRQSGQKPQQSAVLQPQSHQPQRQELPKQKPKRTLEFPAKEQPQLEQTLRHPERRMDKIYSGNNASSDLGWPERIRRYERQDRSKMPYEIGKFYQDEPDDETCREEDDEIRLVQPSILHRLQNNSDRPAYQKSQKRGQVTTISDRRTAASRPRHWCREGSRLQPTQSREEMLFQCPYVTLSLHAQTFECADCIAATRRARHGRQKESHSHQRDLSEESDDAPVRWSKNHR